MAILTLIISLHEQGISFHLWQSDIFHIGHCDLVAVHLLSFLSIESGSDAGSGPWQVSGVYMATSGL